MWKCKDISCTREFKTYNTMFAHFQAKHLEPRFPCPVCEQTFNRHVSRANHYYKCHVSAETGLVGLPTLKNPVNVSVAQVNPTNLPNKSSLSSYIAFTD
jgi:hypothetical protein